MENSFSILHDLEVNAKLEDVFRMVSVPEFLNEWWTHYCKGVPELNSEYIFEFSEEYIWKGKISKFNPPYEIEFLITDADADWTGTKVGFILKETVNGIKISFYHTDWKHTNEHFRQTSFCWAVYLRILRRFVEEGLHIPYSERYHF
ncbi:SRPBCC family protein [Chryseobacterium sp. MIQD13]|uniref:SRPBCC family protein n=1 Tax=Chryseobacterium sp. MIQD13 TaxID=3422310 RepID=UPI003D29A025